MNRGQLTVDREVPRGALPAYLELFAAVLAAGRTPCQNRTRSDLWYSPLVAEQEAAAAGCRVCPARIPCRDYATAAGERWGIWGGTSARQRGTAADEPADESDPGADR